MFNQKNQLATLICFILAIHSIHSGPTCKSGEVQFTNSQCDSPIYIEGCLIYKSRIECDVCSYNYAKVNGICQFQPNSVNKCCLEFDFNGQCKKCSQGLYLNPSDKQCIDIKLPGCLERNIDACVNCANNFKLVNGSCVTKIKGCVQYTKSSSDFFCSKCEDNFNLYKGECAPSWKIYHEKQCLYPFTINKEKGICQVPNCKNHFQWGCYECNNEFDLTKNGECIPRTIPGCIDYANEKECKICEDSLYLLFRGICYPFGCLEINQNLQCVNCNSKLGYVLQQGQCVIPNCVYAGKNGCNICGEGRIWMKNQCVPESQVDTTVGVTCAPTHFLNTNNECQIKQEGCAEYRQNLCFSCDHFYVFDSFSKKCIRRTPGCIYNDKAQCVSCQSQYVYNQAQQKCFIIGCGKYTENGRCAECTLFFKLNVEEFCSIQNCVEITEKGCSKCIENYQVNKDGLCSPYDPFCVARNIYDKCIGCKDGYYIDSTFRCRVSTLGCNYVDGLCVSCRTPFVYQTQTATCFIDGCKQYFFGGCETCVEPYELRYNSCKLKHCLVSNNGKCLECDPDYIMKVKTNQCINKDEFCYEYNKEGDCVECAPKYFMSKLQQKCLAREPGCIYDDQDKCSKCFAPFKPVIGKNKCYISGCLEHNLDNCKQSRYPFELNENKTCVIKNCLKSDDEKCVDCFGNYLLENGLCTTGDSNCVEYNFKQGQCLKCKQGYKVTLNKCQYEDAHCQSFTENGNCKNCQRLYFLNPLNQCELRDSNCQEYVNGYCTKCKPYFYQFESSCYQNTKGCAIQSSINKCEKCEDGYKLDGGKCIQAMTKLNWNSIDMDFFGSDNSNVKEELQQFFTVGKRNKINLDPCLKTGYGRFFYSSDCENTKSVAIEMDGNGWQPKSENNEFIGVVLPKKETLYAVDIKCMANNRMTSFTVEYLDVTTSTVFKRLNSYDLLCEAPGVVKTIYFTPVQAFAIRIKTRKGLPNIKIEFYYNNQQYKPIEVLKNDTIIKQTIQSTIEAARQLLTNNCKDRELCWFGLDICEARSVDGFVIQNDAVLKGIITSVYVDYSVDGIDFTCYDECRSINITDGIVKFNKSVFGTKVRVHISGYQGEPDIRVKFDYN